MTDDLGFHAVKVRENSTNGMILSWTGETYLDKQSEVIIIIHLLAYMSIIRIINILEVISIIYLLAYMSIIRIINILEVISIIWILPYNGSKQIIYIRIWIAPVFGVCPTCLLSFGKNPYLAVVNTFI